MTNGTSYGFMDFTYTLKWGPQERKSYIRNFKAI